MSGQNRSGGSRSGSKVHQNHSSGNNRRLGREIIHLNDNRNKSGELNNAFGFKRLTEFLAQTNDEVIMALDKSLNNFRENLRQECNDDIMIVLIQIVGEKICGETSLQEIQNKLVALSTESLFLEKILKFTSQIPALKTDAMNRDGNVDRCPARTLDALSAFYGRLCARMPAFAADKLLPYIQGARNISELLSLKGVLPKEKSSEIEVRFDNLIKEINMAKESAEQNSTKEFGKKLRKRHEITIEDREKLYQMAPVNDFREISIIPSKEEILSDEEPFLRPNLIVGKYPSTLTYLDVQFRLIREDFLAPLRESVKKYFLRNVNDHDSKYKRPAPGTIRIYRDVELHKVQCSVDVTLFTMKFSTINLKKVKWENSKRFLNGSLLLLTPDRFKNIYFATVGRRDERKLPHGLVDIIWEGKRPDTYNNVKFLMIECEVYFESYRHTLKALQVMAEPCPPHYDRPRFQTYKMSKYIVDVTENEIPPPQYLRNVDWSTERLNFGMVLQSNQHALKLYKEEIDQWKKGTEKPSRPKLQSFKINPLQLSEWPTATDLGMDRPQYVAFRSAITQELAIIQGPPGTGKTYIGLKIMKLLLSNPLGTTQGPILIVCYTNHALDQFLEGILSIMDSLNVNPYGKLVRVGGQSKVEDIQQYNIRNIRSEYLKRKQFDDNHASLRLRTRHKLLLLEDYRSDLKSLFADLCHPNGVVNFTRLNEQIQNQGMSGVFNLSSIIPDELASIFLKHHGGALLDFLRLNNHEFDSDNFTAKNIIKRWFRVTVNPITRRKAEVNEEVETLETELEDEELRSILVAHRLEEEILEEDRKYKAERLQYHLCPTHADKFNSSEDQLSSELQVAQRQRNYDDVRRFQGELYELGLQRNKFLKQCNFMKEFFQCYLDGRIDLPKITPDLLAKANEKASLWRLSLSEKWAFYFYFIDEIKKYLLSEIIKIEANIMDAQRIMEEVKNQGDGFILQRAQVVGMTTTGAAKYNTVLRMIQSKIVIVEEAAEVLESHIITSITEHCEHLILIGDHQQLRPPTTVYKLAKDYQLDVSLFERLIKNNISWQYLRAQHRMRPEICKLLVPTIYRDLENHSSVDNYPPVRGFLKNIFFVNHSSPEKADNDSMTKSNEYEAQYVTQLCRYLMLQGYKSSQITILTTYIGQMFLIKKLITLEGDTCRGVRVTVVDNFQGEENDIILLSLVRSNDENKIGFLRTDNRICVALSRAKQGFYIMGNMDCLVNSPSNTWKKISGELEEQGSIGRSLKILCRNHEEISDINSPEEFRLKSPEGGCTKMCPAILPRCDHACRKICHIVDSAHEFYQCKKDCERHCPDPARHKCPNVCYIYPCPPCQTKMKRTLLCGHVIELLCHIDVVNYSCELLVMKQLKCEHFIRLKCSVPAESHKCEINEYKELECGHTKRLPCYVPATQFECVETVTKDLDCGHKSVMKCVEDPSKFNCRRPTSRILPCGHEQIAPCKDDIGRIKCLTLLDEVNPYCKHKVQVPCHQLGTPEEWKCTEDCDTRLSCGHQCMIKCHIQDDPDHLQYSCKKNCARSCINDHGCRRNHPCDEECGPCNILTNKTLNCGHQINVSCSVNVENLRCEKPCQRDTLSCGHDCLKKCSMACEPCTALMKKKSIDCPHTIEVPCHQTAEKSICNELVVSAKMSLCGHVVKVPCRISDTCSPEDAVQFCHNPCSYKFDYDGGCGHICQGNCASCYQGRIHVKCGSKCERILACGHVCKFPCSSLCPPCSDACILQCKHSKCKKECGEPCIDCKERCRWSCSHSKCQKKCSEMCNRKPCNEPCKKKMKCGHDCIGCCGEPCPPFCRNCDKDTVQYLLFGEEDKEDARFVYLESCGDIIHRDAMDTWMSQSTEQSRVSVKRCPKCSKVITTSERYGNIIKKQFKDVLAIRKKIFGNNQIQKQEQQLIAQRIQRHRIEDCQFESVRRFLEAKLFRMRQTMGKHGRQMVLDLVNIDQYTFESLHNIAIWWEEAENNMKPNKPSQTSRRDQKPANLLPDSKNEVLKMYNKVFEMLLGRKLPLSKHEIGDFDQEFSKMHDLCSLGRRRGIDSFDSFAGSLCKYNSAHKHIVQNKPYDKDMQKTTQLYLTELEEIIKIGWESVKEKRVSEIRTNRQNIFKAMGFAGNHWYNCPNGHMYVVADCGALNESGTCPECRSRIGSGSRNTNAIRDERVIQRQINSVVDIFPEEIYSPPAFNDRSRNTNCHRHYNRGGYNRRGRRH